MVDRVSRTAAVLVASTRAAAGVYTDRTGPIIAAWLRERGFGEVDPLVVADADVAPALRRLVADQPDLVLTTGGTGVAPGDRTPEATRALLDAELDGSKGVAMSFRPWDGQLRQTMLLTDGQGVIGTAPVDGVLHPKNSLDTLGVDAPEKLCKVAR